MIQTQGNGGKPYFVQLSSYKISEKNKDPILRKVSHRRTDRRTDRGTRVISLTAVRRTSSFQHSLNNILIPSGSKILKIFLSSGRIKFSNTLRNVL